MAVETLQLTRDHAQLELATRLVKKEKDQYRRIKNDMNNTNHLRHDLHHHKKFIMSNGERVSISRTNYNEIQDYYRSY